MNEFQETHGLHDNALKIQIRHKLGCPNIGDHRHGKSSTRVEKQIINITAELVGGETTRIKGMFSDKAQGALGFWCL